MENPLDVTFQFVRIDVRFDQVFIRTEILGRSDVLIGIEIGQDNDTNVT